MPGPIEEAGETARTIVDALKGYPALLSIIVLQMVTIGILAYTAHERNIYETGVNKSFTDLITALIRQCGPLKQGEIPLPLPFPPEVPRDG